MLKPTLLQVLFDKLDRLVDLGEHDKAALSALPQHHKTIPTGGYIVREGTKPDHCAILLQGYAIRQKLSADGKRQILAIQIAGDPLDAQHMFLDCADHNVQALGEARVAIIPRHALQTVVMSRPALTHAFAVNGQIDASIFREWLLNIGRRDARKRLAHLFCEIAVRLETSGQSTPDGFYLPMSQEELGDATSLTSVHVNRSLRILEDDGFIARNGRTIQLPDKAATMKMAGFDPRYLHLGRQSDAVIAASVLNGEPSRGADDTYGGSEA